MVHADQRRSPRVEARIGCTLRRERGSAIAATTRDIGPGGMCVTTTRPLVTDEVLSFDLPLAGEQHVIGCARVLRQELHDRYALRFEELAGAARERLAELAS